MKSKIAFYAAAISAVIAFTTPSGRAVDTPSAPEPLRANVSSIEDNRSSARLFSIGSCRLMLNLVGDGLDDSGVILWSRPTRAVDDLNRDLMPGDSDSRMATGSRMFGAWLGRRSNFTIMISLRNPSRRANEIKLLEGVVGFYLPSVSNEGLVKVAGPLPETGPVKNPTLDKYGIGLTPISEEKAKELNRTRPPYDPSSLSSFPDDQRRLEAVSAEVARRRALREEFSSTSPEVVRLEAPREPAPVPSSSSAAAAASSPSRTGSPGIRTYFEVTDPQHKLVDAIWRDAHGGALQMTKLPTLAGNVLTVQAAEPLPKDAQLWLYVASDQAITERQFKVESIALP